MYPWRFAHVELTQSPLWILLHSWPRHFDNFVLRDVAINIAIYIPAGITGHLAFRRFRKIWLAVAAPVLISMVLSASVEMVQLWVPSRTTNLLDLTTNTVGAIVGVMLAMVLEDVFPALRTGRMRKPLDRSAVALAGCWVMWTLFPLIPILGRTTLRNKAAIFVHAPVFVAVPLLSAALAWFAAGGLLQAGGLPSVRRLILLSTLLIPAQFLIVDRQPSPAEMIGALAGAICYSVVWPRRRDDRDIFRKALAAAFLCTIAIRGLAPFVISPEAAPFSWIPFVGFLNTEWRMGMIVIAGKFFWYGTAVWLLCAAGMRMLTSTATVAGLLLLIEIAQTHIPGHISEITDPMLAVIAAWSVLVLRRR